MKYRGFTLVELLVVMSVVSFLSSVTLSAVSTVRVKARDAQRLSQLTQVANALELYRNQFGRYPLYASGWDEMVPGDWQSMMMDLDSNGFLKATFTMDSDQEEGRFFAFAKKAYAVVFGPTYYPCSIQDPLYKQASDYQNSYGYAATGGGSGYKVRIKLENLSHPVLSSGFTGTFLDTAVTGATACDKSLGYFCKSI